MEIDPPKLESHPQVIVPAINKEANLRNQETRIKVTVVSPKSVTFVLNDQKNENIQLINPLKVHVNIGEVIEVTIWQITNTGLINQVKIIES